MTRGKQRAQPAEGPASPAPSTNDENSLPVLGLYAKPHPVRCGDVHLPAKLDCSKVVVAPKGQAPEGFLVSSMLHLAHSRTPRAYAMLLHH
jgi:hypothetical protein